MDMQIKGKSAMITGAGRGLGKAIALGLSKESADVAVCDIFEDRIDAVVNEIKSMGHNAVGIKCDVTNREQVTEAVAKVITDLGKIDILVNNAGGSRDIPFTQSTHENWGFTINLCLYGVLNCTKAVINHMVERKSGKIVNIVSDAGRVGEPSLPIYSAAKAGIIGFAKALAKEIGQYCINVNCISPGVILTERTIERRQQSLAGRGAEAIEESFRRQLKVYPIGRGLGRISTPEEVAAAVIFLCSEQASYITGQTLSVSGGYSMV